MQTQTQPQTKLVRVLLSAFTRVEYSEVIEVPIDMTDADLQALADRCSVNVDGGKYCPDPEYWETATTRCEDADADDKATLKLVDDDLVEITSTKHESNVLLTISSELIPAAKMDQPDCEAPSKAS